MKDLENRITKVDLEKLETRKQFAEHVPGIWAPEGHDKDDDDDDK